MSDSMMGTTATTGVGLGSGSTMTGGHALATLFATRAAAESAAEALVHDGIPRAAITVVDQSTSGVTTTAQATEDTGGFWDSLKRMFSGADDVEGYYEGIHRGQTLLTVHTTSAAESDKVAATLERFDPIDLDTQEATWRREGWTGRANTTRTDVVGAAGLAATTATAGAAARGAEVTGDQKIQLMEERVAVGKRDIQRGSVRVRTYVVETPVTEEVRLREEHVTIERHAVDRPVDAATIDAFKGRTIELTERGEEAVIAKTARVTEELTIGKNVTERTEQVHETARRTEVEVDDGRTGVTKGSTTTTTGVTGTTATPVKPRV